MGILEKWRELGKYKPWRSDWAWFGWSNVILPLVLITVMIGVGILGSAVVGGSTASTGALITVVLVAISAAVIAGVGLQVLVENRLPPATYQRVGLAAFWAAVLALGVLLAFAYR